MIHPNSSFQRNSDIVLDQHGESLRGVQLFNGRCDAVAQFGVFISDFSQLIMLIQHISRAIAFPMRCLFVRSSGWGSHSLRRDHELRVPANAHIRVCCQELTPATPFPPAFACTVSCHILFECWPFPFQYCQHAATFIFSTRTGSPNQSASILSRPVSLPPCSSPSGVTSSCNPYRWSRSRRRSSQAKSDEAYPSTQSLHLSQPKSTKPYHGCSV